NTEVDGVHAEAGDNRQEDGCEDQNCRGDIHEHTGNQKQQVDEQQDDVLVIRNAQQRLTDGVGQTGEGQNEAHNRRSCDQEHDNCGGLAGIAQDARQVGGLNALIDDHGEEQGVCNSDSSRLGRGEDTGGDTADDDDDEQDAGDGFHEVAEQYLDRNALAGRILVLL